MDDANKPEGKGGEEEISPALRDLIKYKTTGTSTSHEIPLPEEMVRVRKDLRELNAELNAEQEAKQGDREISPAMRDLINYKATGKSASHEIPLPEDVKRAQQFLQEWHAEHEAQQQGPERFIGPRNPDHPSVNRDPGGRTPD